MGSTIGRSGFVAYFKGGAIDVNRIAPETLATLDRAAQAAVAQGVADTYLKRLVQTPNGILGELKRIAGADGRIELGRFGTDVELRQLFTFMEHFDRNGSSESSRLYARGSPLAPVLTPAGEVYQALRGERLIRDTTNRNGFVSLYSSGHFDLQALTPEARIRLAQLGVDLSALDRLGDEGTRLHGGGALGRLFVMLERLDERGADNRLDRRKEMHENEVGEHTRAGEALALLEKVFLPFARVRGEPLVDAGVTPIALAVPHVVQTGDGCFRTDRVMVDKFEKGLRAKVPDGNEAFYMAMGEDAEGRVHGMKDTFDRGRRIVDATLERGRPIIVGLSHSQSDVANLDGITDHFIVITGRGVDEQGRVFYSFNDSATSDPDYRTSGRLFVDASSGILYMDPIPGAPYPLNLGYQVTQVRPYRDTSMVALGVDAAS